MEMNSNLTMSQVLDIIKSYEKTIQDFYNAMSEGLTHIPQSLPYWKEVKQNVSAFQSKLACAEPDPNSSGQTRPVDRKLMEKLYKLHYISSIDLAGSLDDFKEAFKMAQTLG